MIQEFVTADPHLDHINILKHTPRPFSTLEENNETLVDNWNSIVPRGGKVTILGDFARRNHAKWLHRLNGKKILVKGSHDRMSLDALRLFKEVHTGGVMLNFGNHRMFWCAHNCHRVYERGHYGIGHLFGHSHGRLETYNMSVDVGVDSGRCFKKYFPIPIEEVLAWMSLREEEMRKAGRVVEERGKSLYRQDDVWWMQHRAPVAGELETLPEVAREPEQDPGY